MSMGLSGSDPVLLVRRDDIGYGSSGGQVGPEMVLATSGVSIEQVLVIKACWGGRALVIISFHPVLANTPNLLSLAIPVFTITRFCAL